MPGCGVQPGGKYGSGTVLTKLEQSVNIPIPLINVSLAAGLLDTVSTGG